MDLRELKETIKQIQAEGSKGSEYDANRELTLAPSQPRTSKPVKYAPSYFEYMENKLRRKKETPKKRFGEGIEVKTGKYSWGTMKTIHHNKDFSIPLHPEHQQAISKLKDEQEHKFKDETGRHWVARRKDDHIHFSSGSMRTHVPVSSISEQKVEQFDPNKNPVGKKGYLVNEENDAIEKKEMAQTQLHFIGYAAKEILEFIDMGGEIEEWYQNKLSKVQSEVESLHSYIEGEKRRTGMVKEEVERVDEAGIMKTIKRVAAGWGAFDKDKPRDIVRNTKSRSHLGLKQLAARKVGKGSPAALQQKVAKRELAKLEKEEVEQTDEAAWTPGWAKKGYHSNTIGAIAAAAYVPKVGDKIRTRRGGQIPGVVTKVTNTHVHFTHPEGKKYKTSVNNVMREEVEQVDEVNSRHSDVAMQQALTPKASQVKAAAGKTRRDVASTNKLARRLSKISGDYSKKDIIDSLKSLAKEEAEHITEGGPTRKHFQQVADLIKANPNPELRAALAKHHANIFKDQNPRFDHKRFYKAAGVEVNESAVESGSNVVDAEKKTLMRVGSKNFNPIERSRIMTALRSKNPTRQQSQVLMNYYRKKDSLSKGSLNQATYLRNLRK